MDARGRASYYLAIDCGGTKTVAAIAETGGRCIALGVAGPSNYTTMGLEKYLAAIAAAVDDAWVQANVPRAVDAVWVGAAGIDNDADVERVAPHVARLVALPWPSPQVQVTNDAYLVGAPLRRHDATHEGVVAIAGTGSVVLRFMTDTHGGLHQLTRVGGFGWLLGDEGSAYRIGHAAVCRALEYVDEETFLQRHAGKNGTVATDETHHAAAELCAAILAQWQLESSSEMLASVYAPMDTQGRALLRSETKHRLAGLCRTVFHLALERQNAVCVGILEEQAAALAAQIAQAVHRSAAVRSEAGVLCVGGSLLNVPEYLELVLVALAKRHVRFARVEAVDQAAVAAAAALARLTPVAAE